MFFPSLTKTFPVQLRPIRSSFENILKTRFFANIAALDDCRYIFSWSESVIKCLGLKKGKAAIVKDCSNLVIVSSLFSIVRQISFVVRFVS